jgi:hypothetical protein
VRLGEITFGKEERKKGRREERAEGLRSRKRGGETRRQRRVGNAGDGANTLCTPLPFILSSFLPICPLALGANFPGLHGARAGIVPSTA